jgi:hypothetical protein
MTCIFLTFSQQWILVIWLYLRNKTLLQDQTFKKTAYQCGLLLLQIWRETLLSEGRYAYTKVKRLPTIIQFLLTKKENFSSLRLIPVRLRLDLRSLSPSANRPICTTTPTIIIVPFCFCVLHQVTGMENELFLH